MQTVSCHADRFISSFQKSMLFTSKSSWTGEKKGAPIHFEQMRVFFICIWWFRIIMLKEWILEQLNHPELIISFRQAMFQQPKRTSMFVTKNEKLLCKTEHLSVAPKIPINKEFEV